jgi:hypothetical protein
MKNIVGRMKDAGFYSWLFLAAIILLAAGCEEDEGDFFLSGITFEDSSGSLKSATEKIPVHPLIRATFSRRIDPGTVLADNLILLQDYNKEIYPVAVEIEEETLLIRPRDTLCGGIRYTLKFERGIRSHRGTPLVPCSASFNTSGTFAPRGAVAYWDFNGNVLDSKGVFNPSSGGVVDIAYEASHHESAGRAARFNGTTSIIEIPHAASLWNAQDFTLCFWMKALSNDHLDGQGNPAGYFVMGLAAYFGFNFEIGGDFLYCNLAGRYDYGGGRSLTNDLLFGGDGMCRMNGGWIGTEFCRDLRKSGGIASLLRDKWANIVYRFDSSTRSAFMYINGQLCKVQNFNLWPDDYVQRMIKGLRYDGHLPDVADDLAFGFIQSRAGTFYDDDPRYGYDFPTSGHFKGMLDDVRIYHRVITEQEIRMMYDSER